MRCVSGASCGSRFWEAMFSPHRPGRRTQQLIWLNAANISRAPATALAAIPSRTGHPWPEGARFQTPFGTIDSPNITPDKDSGIGQWSDDDFYRLIHDGINRAGDYIYPVMPFDHYTQATRQDDLAIKAYLFSLPPVHTQPPASHLQFPFNIRTSLAGWRALFFKPGTFASNPSLSEQENRGAYLVEGLGHCGACHTPHNVLGATEQGKSLGGGEITGQGWFAPNITSDLQQGIGSWSEQQVVDYFKRGVAPGRAVDAGPMAEVISSSLHYLSDDDLHAIAAYLKVAPGKQLYAEQHATSPPGAPSYLTYCASCHGPDGRGIPNAVPPLADNGVVKAGGPQDVLRTVLGGLPAKADYAAMPGFALTLTSGQIAEIANFVRSSWGNAAPPTATTSMVDELGHSTASMLAGTKGCDSVTATLADAVRHPDLQNDLHDINAANMLEQIDKILAQLKTANGQVARADLTNGLTAAYCAVLHDNGQMTSQQVLLLQRFASLVYSQTFSGSPHQASLTRQGTNPRGN